MGKVSGASSSQVSKKTKSVMPVAVSGPPPPKQARVMRTVRSRPSVKNVTKTKMSTVSRPSPGPSKAKKKNKASRNSPPPGPYEDLQRMISSPISVSPSPGPSRLAVTTKTGGREISNSPASPPPVSLFERSSGSEGMEDSQSQNKLTGDMAYEYELKGLPTLTDAAIPRLMQHINSVNLKERLACTVLLAKLFSEKKSDLEQSHLFLWENFMRRFGDREVSIRLKCVQSAEHFLTDHQNLSNDIVQELKARLLDVDENVRFEVVKAILAVGLNNYNIVLENEDLIGLMKSVQLRTLDKQFKVRKLALEGLGKIYEKYSNYVPHADESIRRAVAVIPERILHSYYMESTNDKLTVENVVYKCLVPVELESRERMVKLLYLLVNSDDNAFKGFTETQKNLILIRRHFGGLMKRIDELREDQKSERELSVKVSHLNKFLPDPVKGIEFLSKFAVQLKCDTNLSKCIRIVLSEMVSSKVCAENAAIALGKIRKSPKSKLASAKYCDTIKILIERSSAVLMDQTAIEDLIALMREIVDDKFDVTLILGVDKSAAMDKGFRLLKVSAFGFPHLFHELHILESLVELMIAAPEEQRPTLLSALSYTGKRVPMQSDMPELMESLVPECKKMILEGTPKQAKEAVRCLFSNVNANNLERGEIFDPLIEDLSANLESSNTYFRTHIVAIGHISLHLGDQFGKAMKPTIAKKFWRQLLLSPLPNDENRLGDEDDDEPWCEKEELPEIMKCMLAAMKATARWLIGLKSDLKSAERTLKMFTAFVETGSAIHAGSGLREVEKSWLRLTAACCILKICQHQGVGDGYTLQQVCEVSKLMNDPVLEVRAKFITKLHRGINQGIPNRCLPVHFMGLYALTGYEKDKPLKTSTKSYLLTDIVRRRAFLKGLLPSLTNSEQTSNIIHSLMPDYMLSYAIPILTHSPNFTDYEDMHELEEIKECLWFVMEPLMRKNDSYNFAFYKQMIEQLKNCRDNIEPDNDVTNCKMYAICDIALGLLVTRTSTFDLNCASGGPRISRRFFNISDDFLTSTSNTRSYIPKDMQFGPAKRAGSGSYPTRVSSENSSPQSQGQKRGRPKKPRT